MNNLNHNQNYISFETKKEKDSICADCNCPSNMCRHCDYQSVDRYNQECGECITVVAGK
ncbi:MAG: hypothetical protein RSF40_01215 [Oscillospiraceae bacterium]